MRLNLRCDSVKRGMGSDPWADENEACEEGGIGAGDGGDVELEREARRRRDQVRGLGIWINGSRSCWVKGSGLTIPRFRV